MLKISAAYGAKWSSAFGDRDLRYNERLWSVVEEMHSPEDMVFGLIDKSDGSSFMIRIEAIEGLAEIDDGAIEQSLVETISSPKLNAVESGRSVHRVSGMEFRALEHHVTNPKFGEQVLWHAYARGNEEVIFLMMSWPRAMPLHESGYPVKHKLLLDGLSL